VLNYQNDGFITFGTRTSLLHALGVPLKTISEIVRRSDLRLANSVYWHAWRAYLRQPERQGGLWVGASAPKPPGFSALSPGLLWASCARPRPRRIPAAECWLWFGRSKLNPFAVVL